MTGPQPSSQEIVSAAIDEFRHTAGPLLPVLHAIQDRVGHIPPDAVPAIADGLNLSRAEVHGVISFYHYFRRTPPGRHVVQICRAEACQSMQGEALERHVKNRLGIDYHETSRDGAVSLEPVYCLGNCACSPAVMIDRTLYGRVDAERMDELLAACGARV